MLCKGSSLGLITSLELPSRLLRSLVLLTVQSVWFLLVCLRVGIPSVHIGSTDGRIRIAIPLGNASWHNSLARQGLNIVIVVGAGEHDLMVSYD